MPKVFPVPTSFDDARRRLSLERRRIVEIEGQIGKFKADPSDDSQTRYRNMKAALSMAQSEVMFLKDWMGERAESDDRAPLLSDACITCSVELPPFDRGGVYVDGWIKLRLSARGNMYTAWICPSCGVDIHDDVIGYIGARDANSSQQASGGNHLSNNRADATQRPKRTGAG